VPRFAVPGLIVEVAGKVGSKKPAEFECLRMCDLLKSPAPALGGNVKGEAVRSDESLAPAPVGV
jgi:hypothetical protein